MKAASEPRRADPSRRLLLIDAEERTLYDELALDLSAHLAPDDLLIVNDAATLPASFRLRNLDAELRLVGKTESESEYFAVLFGPGDYHTPTERRPPPPRVDVGQSFELDARLGAEVVSIDERSARLLRIRFSLQGAELMRALYRNGRPIQYAHVPEPLALWDVQNRFASRPWAFEAPSAGFALDGEQLARLAARGVRVGYVTHATGISSTGSAELDARLPLPERFEIPASTIAELERAKVRGGRVVAVGTSVVRALEASALEHGSPRAGPGVAHLRLGPDTRRRVVDAVLSGMHEAGTSHFELLEAFAEARLLTLAVEQANRLGYLAHEFGDLCLVWGSPARRWSTSAPLAA
jgi:S-adenosylmethionine:tRNA ribosyltransferase-isomerase